MANVGNHDEKIVQKRPEPTTDAPTERPKVDVVPVLFTERERVVMEIMADLGFEIFPVMDIYINTETKGIRAITFHNVLQEEKLFDDPNIIVKRWNESERPEEVSRPTIFGDPIPKDENGD
ncbi:hypothetical protein LCGC14_1094160 [marine sediment metagenome]|uniref:Uncharacterized protein n=1 Tax=marine sediment metagenome TaxID=412755 RepID=A0A0F9MBG2_9ZZZZ